MFWSSTESLIISSDLFILLLGKCKIKNILFMDYKVIRTLLIIKYSSIMMQKKNCPNNYNRYYYHTVKMWVVRFDRNDVDEYCNIFQ